MRNAVRPSQLLAVSPARAGVTRRPVADLPTPVSVQNARQLQPKQRTSQRQIQIEARGSHTQQGAQAGTRQEGFVKGEECWGGKGG